MGSADIFVKFKGISLFSQSIYSSRSVNSSSCLRFISHTALTAISRLAFDISAILKSSFLICSTAKVGEDFNILSLIYLSSYWDFFSLPFGIINKESATICLMKGKRINVTLTLKRTWKAAICAAAPLAERMEATAFSMFTTPLRITENDSKTKYIIMPAKLNIKWISAALLALTLAPIEANKAVTQVPTF